MEKQHTKKSKKIRGFGNLITKLDQINGFSGNNISMVGKYGVAFEVQCNICDVLCFTLPIKREEKRLTPFIPKS